jgi:hypothetical protein
MTASAVTARRNAALIAAGVGCLGAQQVMPHIRFQMWASGVSVYRKNEVMQVSIIIFKGGGMHPVAL